MEGRKWCCEINPVILFFLTGEQWNSGGWRNSGSWQMNFQALLWKTPASPLCLAGLEEGIRARSEQLEISVEPDCRGDHEEGNADEIGKGKSI